MRRAAVSIPSNIAEGKGYRTDKGFANFLFHARGSLLELETQIEVACALAYLPKEQSEQLLSQTKTVGSLTGLIYALAPPERFRRSMECFADDRRPMTDD